MYFFACDIGTNPQLATAMAQERSRLSVDEKLPHSKTTLVRRYTSEDYGPLSILSEGEAAGVEVMNAFKDGTYWMTSVLEEGLYLHKVKSEIGSSQQSFWTIHVELPDLTTQFDSSVLAEWNTSYEITSIIVPSEIHLYEGYTVPEETRLSQNVADHLRPKGDWRVFVPQSVLKPLIEATKYLIQSDLREDTSEKVEEQWKLAIQAQVEHITHYNKQLKLKMKEMMEKEFSSERVHSFLTKGNCLHELDKPVRQALEEVKFGEVQVTGDVLPPNQSYIIHRHKVRLPDGSSRSANLKIRLEYLHSKSTKSGSATFMTHYYKLVMEWC